MFSTNTQPPLQTQDSNTTLGQFIKIQVQDRLREEAHQISF